MKILLSTALLLAAANTFAGEAAQQCNLDGKPLAVNDSVWVLDPHIVKEMTSKMIERGFNQELIDSEIKKSDWAGFRIKCIETFTINTNPRTDVFGDSVKKTGVALVLNEYSSDYYADTKEHLNKTGKDERSKVEL